MTEYEMVTLFHPRLDEDGVTEISEWLQQRIVDLGGENTGLTTWGRRTLAYPVHKQTEAVYVQFDFKLEGRQMTDPSLVSSQISVSPRVKISRLAFDRARRE